ncbi:MAG TPA: hypothetical protein DCX52_03320 [Massilia sp.]|nr:hypothetical protein [Massilia sp.]
MPERRALGRAGLAPGDLVVPLVLHDDDLAACGAEADAPDDRLSQRAQLLAIQVHRLRVVAKIHREDVVVGPDHVARRFQVAPVAFREAGALAQLLDREGLGIDQDQAVVDAVEENRGDVAPVRRQGRHRHAGGVRHFIEGQGLRGGGRREQRGAEEENGCQMVHVFVQKVPEL